ncbi:unnamed protein product, partial [Toxocara canis]|uniref:RanBD1 domain-containing protein n=1 Tax=Toxocara canis TaxID=6265 RepID=A0A183U9D5_TOXCA
PTVDETAVPVEGQTWGKKKLWTEVAGTGGRAQDQAGCFLFKFRISFSNPLCTRIRALFTKRVSEEPSH